MERTRLHRHAGARPRWTRLAWLVALIGSGTTAIAAGGPASADVTDVAGSAFGYYTDVSLFGGPSSDNGPAPSVKLPAGGSAAPVIATDADGGKAQYGPAVVFGGIWPEEAPTGGPSGPITVSTQGTPAGGSVTSSVDIVLHNPPKPLAPGGIGPGPLISDEVHSTCTADEGGVTGSVRFVNGIIETKYDEDTQLPIVSEPIPLEPPPEYTRMGTIDHVGDHFKIVLNEQVTNADGSLTVNAAHMYLLGPIAVGEMIVGQVTCGVTSDGSSPAPGGGSTGAAPSGGSGSSGGSSSGDAASSAATEAASASTTAPPSSTVTDESSTTTTASSKNAAAGNRPGGNARSDLAARAVADRDDGGLPLVLPMLALVAGGVGAVIWARRRRQSRPAREA